MSKFILFSSLILILFFGKCFSQTFQCPEKNGLFPNPANASTYYQCSNGFANLQSCPSTLVFNATASACDFDTEHVSSSNNTISPLCPRDGYFVHPTDQHKFYECANGIANLFNCSENLVFNTTLNACSFDPNAQLITQGTTTTRGTTVPPPATSTGAAVTTVAVPETTTPKATTTLFNKILSYFFK